jgi:threonylcarbamoyladenosine tRNA methylthiotransferase CDKAL1
LDRIHSSPLLVYDRWLGSGANLSSRKKPSWFIKIASGCLNACEYCPIKNSRDALKSKTPEKIINEFREGLVRGFQNFVLLGTDLGRYGFETGVDLTTLLDQLIGERGDFEIRLRNIESRWLLRLWPKMQPILASGKIDLLGIPIESGNDEVLKGMDAPRVFHLRGQGLH